MKEDEELPDPDQARESYEKWAASLPAMVSESHQQFVESTKPYESFQLIANLTHYNHLHSADQYTDARGDRMFIIAEIVAMQCLKGKYKQTCEIPEQEFFESVSKVQEAAYKYFTLYSAHALQQTDRENETTLQQITRKLSSDEIHVRNPGHPDHHLIFSEELFKPMETQLTAQFGFSIDQRMAMHKGLVRQINTRYADQMADAARKGDALKNEVLSFQRTGVIPEESLLSREQFEEFKDTPAKELKSMFVGYYYNQVMINLKKVYVFTAGELAEFSNVSQESAQNFLDHLSVGFGGFQESAPLITVHSILKTKPIIRNGQNYILPSFPLLTWAVEPMYETFIKSSQKLSAKYKDIKHDFLLRKGYEYFSSLLSTGTLYPQNLYYEVDGKVCETDGLIAYDTILFIIEAKGNRISNKAKEGSFQRTESHLEDLIRDATLQGKRTLDYIRSNEQAVFFTKNKKEKFTIDSPRFDEFFIVSLTLEPVGHLTPLIKVANDLNFFPAGVFPWIISIYDLLVIADHIQQPILFIHYLQRRKRFLEIKNFSIYEEIDLLAYFLHDGLYVEQMVHEAEDQSITRLGFDNATDEINDYYMYKFGDKTKITPKVQIYLPKEFLRLLESIESSNIEHRNKIMLELLRAEGGAIEKLLGHIAKARKEYRKDKKLQNASISNGMSIGGIGLTYLIGKDRKDLDEKLYYYCFHKFSMLRSGTWVGIGDLNPARNEYNIRCSFIAKSELKDGNNQP